MSYIFNLFEWEQNFPPNQVKGIPSDPLHSGSNDHPHVFCLDDSLIHLKIEMTFE